MKLYALAINKHASVNSYSGNQNEWVLALGISGFLGISGLFVPIMIGSWN